MIVSDLPAWAIRAFAFLFGALWGSFFNVAIYRWPRDMSVVTPPSHCPHCGAPVPAYRNVPILGYLLLRGRAACCGHKLTPRYALVELISAALCLALAERYVLSNAPAAALSPELLEAALYFVFVGGLIIATFVDLEWMEIPDEVSIGGAAVGLGTVMFRDDADAVDMALGAGGGFLLVQLVLVWSWERLTGRRGMGEGDSKFLMFIGAFVGWRGALFALVAGAFQGMIVSALLLALGRRSDGRAPAEPESESEAESDGESDAESESESEGDSDSEAEGELTLADGARATLRDAAHRLQIHDGAGRLLWEYLVEEDEDGALRRKIPFGPFLALSALEFLFFGERLIEAYMSLFD